MELSQVLNQLHPNDTKEFPLFVNVVGLPLEELTHLLETHHLITGNL